LLEGEDVLENGSFEETTVGPEEWDTTVYSGEAEHTFTAEEANSGDQGVRISSTEGADASWNQTVEVEPDTEYTLSGWIKTENVENLEDTGFVDITPVGAALNVDEVGGASDADVRTDGITGTTDWAEVSVTFNSGSNSELTVNGLFGGWGESTGTAWYDDLSLEDPDGNDLLSNPGFESGSATPQPVGWTAHTWGGEGEFTLDESESRNGDNSVRIDSEAGLDGAWNQIVDVEPNTEYTVVGWIKTENVDPGTGFGAQFNVHELGQDSLTEPVTGTQDWTRVTSTINSGDNEQLQINALMGGWGESTGTAWFDDVLLIGPEKEAPNIVSNPGIEETEGDGGTSPVDWYTETYNAADVEFNVDDSVTHSGDYSARIDSDGGADASWSQDIEVQPNTTYEVTYWIKTENLDAGDSYGALVNLHELQQSYLPEPITGSQDWTKKTFTFNSEEYDQLQFNLLMGGWGQASGTVWWDDIEIRAIGDAGAGSGGIHTIYNRIQSHYQTAFNESTVEVVSDDELGDILADGDGNVLYMFDNDTQGAGASSCYDGCADNWPPLTVDDEAVAGENVTAELTTFERGDGSTQVAANGWPLYTFANDENPGDTTGQGVGDIWWVLDPAGNPVHPWIEPGTAIEFDGQTGGWVGISPTEIEGETNPTLDLVEGEMYEIGWTTGDGAPHNIAIHDEDDSVVDGLSTPITNDPGDDQWLSFEASSEMAHYVCEVHPGSMIGDINIV